MSLLCFYCAEEVDPLSSQTYWRVIGWERRALSSTSRRGGSDIVLRERQDEFAHANCIEKIRQGIAPAQEALL